MLPWMNEEIESARALMGADWWPYGIEANRNTLETFLRYASAQGIAARPLVADELFTNETPDTFKDLMREGGLRLQLRGLERAIPQALRAARRHDGGVARPQRQLDRSPSRGGGSRLTTDAARRRSREPARTPSCR